MRCCRNSGGNCGFGFYLNNLESMWIDVNTLLPNVKDKVLICYTAFGKRKYAEAIYEGDNLFQTREGMKIPTHWSPYICQS